MEVMQRQYVVNNTKEAMHHPHLQVEEDLEDVVEEALLKRRTTSDGSTLTTVSSTSSAAETNFENVSAPAPLGEAQEHDGKNSVYFDENEEMWKCRHCAWNHQTGFPGIDHTHPIHSHFATGGADVGWPQYNVKADDFAAKLEDADIHKVLSTVINGKEDGITSSTVLTKKEPETSATSYEMGESDEEVVELEFETAVEKMHTHADYNMYCPNCSNRITKVVLRRKIRRRPVVPVSPDNERRDLFGCLSCFSIFVSSGNRLNPFRIFAGEGGESTPLPQEPPGETTQPLPPQFTPTPEVTGWRFDLCWPFRKERGGKNALTSPLLPPTDEAIEQGHGANQQEKDDNKSAENGLSGASNDASDDYNISNAVPFIDPGMFGSNGVTSIGTSENIPQTSPPPKGLDSGANLQEKDDNKSAENGLSGASNDASDDYNFSNAAPFIDPGMFGSNGVASIGTSEKIPQTAPPPKGLDSGANQKEKDDNKISENGLSGASNDASEDYNIGNAVPFTDPGMFGSKGVASIRTSENIPQTAPPPKGLDSGANQQEKDDNKSAENGLSGASNDASDDYNISNAVPFIDPGMFGSNGVASIGTSEKIPQTAPPPKGLDSDANQQEKDDNKSAENSLSGASNDASEDYNISNAVPFMDPGMFGSNEVANIGTSEKIPQTAPPPKGFDPGAQVPSADPNVIDAVRIGYQILGKPQSNGVTAVLPAPPPPQGSTLDGNVIIDVPEEHETLIPRVKQPIRPGPEIKGESDGDYQPEGGDEIVPVEETLVEVESPASEAAPIDATRPSIVTESGSSRSLEVVKSVVYGGLMELMTSLSVVSSAAASDATTSNIVVLALANLVGGLVVLAHNLKDLRYGDSSPASENRYKEHLGRKEHFIMHATVAVLSYVVFGLLPPVVYGFTFRESDDRDYKMLAVAVASFLCIVILAIAKAYARREHTFTAYFKTVLYYVAAAAAASGVAFAVGDLANMLVERLGWLNPPPKVGSQMYLDPKSLQPTWASY